MDTSITNTCCSSSIMNTNIIIPKPKHKISPTKNKQQKNPLLLPQLVHFLTVAVNDMFNMVY